MKPQVHIYVIFFGLEFVSSKRETDENPTERSLSSFPKFCVLSSSPCRRDCSDVTIFWRLSAALLEIGLEVGGENFIRKLRLL